MPDEERMLSRKLPGQAALHILVVDDDAFSIAPVLGFVEKFGHGVTHVKSGRDAIAAFVARQPDMILMDVMMPGMDGIEATREIKRLAGDRWVPLIMMTGLGSKQDILAGFEAGADDYLPKPVDLDILYARMESMQRIALIQNQLHRIIDHAHEGIIAIDGQGIVNTFNPAAEGIFGYAAAEVIGKNIAMLMPSPTREAHDGYLARYLKDGVPHIIGKGRKMTGLRKNGKQFPMQLYVTYVRYTGGIQFIGLVRDITHEEAERERIEYLAHYDVLTDLPNRITFHETLTAACAAAQAGERPCALLFIDLDGFKAINDRYGHDVGDEALVMVARRMRHGLAHDDFLSRLGGDEFVAILHDVDTAETAVKVADRLIDTVCQAMELKGHACQLGASIGIALAPRHSAQPDALLTLADDAMYEAKRHGKNRYVVAPFPTYVAGKEEKKARHPREGKGGE